jgi:hypothetical protein
MQFEYIEMASGESRPFLFGIPMSDVEDDEDNQNCQNCAADSAASKINRSGVAV